MKALIIIKYSSHVNNFLWQWYSVYFLKLVAGGFLSGKKWMPRIVPGHR